MIVEVLVVAGLSLGQSGVYAVVRLLDLLSRAPLSEAQANLNTSANDRPWFDLTYQLLGIGFALVPVALVLLLLSRDRMLRGTHADADASAVRRSLPEHSLPEHSRPEHSLPAHAQAPWAQHPQPSVLSRLGVAGGRRAGHDLGRGVVLLLVIGVGTLGVYAAGRALGLTAQINTDNLGAHWWTVPVLVLAAVKNSLLEEVLLMGYFRIRLHALGWSPWTVIVALAVLRGSYHLYQGVGPFVGNVAMGLIFGGCALRWERSRPTGTGSAVGGGPGSAIMPFVWAHFLIDVIGFTAPGVLHLVDPLG